MKNQSAYTILQFDSSSIAHTNERPLILKLAGRYLQCSEHYCPTRTIDEYVLLYITQGSGWVELNGVKTAVFKGDIIFLPANKPHSYGNVKGSFWSILWFHFVGTYGEYFFNQSVALKNNGVIATSATPILFEKLSEVISIVKQMKSFVDIIRAEALFSSALCDIYESALAYTAIDSRQKAYVDSAISLLEQNGGEFLSLDELSHTIGISKYYLIRLFKKFTDTTPKDYVNTLKLKKACKLLKETEFSICEISLKLGFCNQYHFSKNFKLFSGYSPSKFRRLTM